MSVGGADVRVRLALEELRQDISRAETLINNLGANRTRINVDTNEAGRALLAISNQAQTLINNISRARSLGLDTKAAQRSLEQLQQEADKVSQSFRRQATLNVNNAQARRQLQEVADAAAVVTNRIRGANATFTVDTSPARRAFQALDGEVQKTSRELRAGIIKGLSGLESFESLGRGVGQNIGSGIRQGITSTISSIVDTTRNIIASSLNASRQFSGSIRSFAALSGEEVNSTAIKGVREEIEKLAIATSKTPQQIAGAAIELTKLGFGAKETKKELGGLIQLSEATGSSLEKAASIVGATNNVFQRSAKDIADIVAATANSTAADANDFLQAVSKAGGVAKANSQDLETLATAFGLIRNAGFEAEAAATAVKTAINRLAAPNPKGQQALTELGVQIRDGTTKEMRNLIELVPEFRAALGKVDPGTRSQLVKTIFGDEGGPAFLALLATSQEKIDSTYQTIRNSSGRAAETSEKLIKGLDGELKRFEGSVQLLQVKLGDAFAPAAEGVVAFGNKVTNNLLQTEGLFGKITSASEAFGAELSNNSELAKEVQSALGLAVEELSIQGIAIITEFTNTLKENPKLLAEMVTATANLVRLLGEAVEKGVKLANVLAQAGQGVSATTSYSSNSGNAVNYTPEQTGRRQAYIKQGIDPKALDTQFEEEVKRLTSGPLGFLRADQRDTAFDNIATQFDKQLDQGASAKRAEQNQKSFEETAAQSDAARIPALAASAKAASEIKPPTKYLKSTDPKKDKKAAADAIKAEALTTSKAESDIKTGESSAIASVKQAQLKGDIDPEQAVSKIASAQNKANVAELAAESEHLKRLQGLKAKGVIDSQKFGEEEVKSANRVRTLKGQILEAELKEREDNNKRALENLERANKLAQSAIAASASARILIVKQQLANQEITEKQAAEKIAKIHQDTTTSDIQLLNKQLADVDKLEKNKVISAKQATDKRIELQSQLAAKNQELVDQEIEGQKRIRDEAIKTIDDRIAGDKRRSDAAIANLDAEQKRLVDFAQKADEITRSLVESRGGLDKAVSDADSNRGQIALDRTNRALDVRKQADQKDVDPDLKYKLEGELKKLGFNRGDTELDILAKRQEQEDKLAKIKLAALEQEQKLKRALEELDIRRLQLVQKQAEFEAKRGVLSAKQAQNEAQGALAKAEKLAPGEERDKAIAIANDQIALSSEGVKLAEENVGLVKEQATSLKEIIASKREALKIDQQSAREQFNAAEESRKSAQRQEAAAAISRNKTSSVPNSLTNNNGDGFQALAPDDKQKETDKLSPTEKANQLYPGSNTKAESASVPLKQKTNSLKDQLEMQPDKSFLNQYLNLDQGKSLVERYSTRTPAIQKTNSLKDQLETQPDKSFLDQYLTPISPKIGNILEQSKGGMLPNQATPFFDSAPIVAEIQKLNSNISTLASRPTTLQVSSPAPVTDAAQIYSDISKNAVRQAKI